MVDLYLRPGGRGGECLGPFRAGGIPVKSTKSGEYITLLYLLVPLLYSSWLLVSFSLTSWYLYLHPPPFCIFLRQHVKRKLFFFMSSLYLLYLLHLFAVGAAEELALPGTCLLSLRSKRCPCRSDEADPKRCLTELSLLWMPVTISSFYYLGGGLAA